jgi:hypothetical protein
MGFKDPGLNRVDPTGKDFLLDLLPIPAGEAEVGLYKTLQGTSERLGRVAKFLGEPAMES